MNTNQIESRPDICNGKPVVKGTRITVQTVLSHLSAGDTLEEVQQAFPRLEREDILACLAYAARLGDVHSRVELVS